ncbi:glycosyltransferase involved in cell wall biosynthesis [Saccharothrix saharensis]|uniref:Glycosyltransferase involved in cell wall biosynthesis n=1 Tax=Saccharothrix saharensis TaxID=571190 RepID=A0A543JQM0_9PSEU|nr:glycosyltransferase family 4 protein [Saccharothrix saharensis]TQM85123.1 glycosyltransferase involved in cell wall biosynthesis [Saccharothrix saharensis]
MTAPRVAMIAPPWFELPPSGYGGTEAMCADLVDRLVARGNHVVLVGVGRNGTAADFRRTADRPQQDRMGQGIPEVVHAAALPAILADLEVDVVHDHSLAGPLLARGRPVPTVVTAHAPVTGDMGRYYRGLNGTVHLVAVSDAQRRLAPDLDWAATVHNAVDVRLFPFRRDKEDFVLFLGRATPDKGIPEAIAAATEAGLPLRIAAKCREPEEQEYFEHEVKPLLGPGVEWLGEVGREDKLALLAATRCLLFPIRWDEPFGLVMVEAMACGTPVVATRRGAVPEVVAHGRTGFVCDDHASLVAALGRVEELSPDRCRAEAAGRFDVDLMAARYEDVYCRVAVGPVRATAKRTTTRTTALPRRVSEQGA